MVYQPIDSGSGAWNLTREQITLFLEELPPQGLLLETYVQEAGESYYTYQE